MVRLCFSVKDANGRQVSYGMILVVIITMKNRRHWANKAGFGVRQLFGTPAIELGQSTQVAAGAQGKQNSQKPSYGCF